MFFGVYAEGGAQELEEGNLTIPGVGGYSISKSTKEIGDYEFEMWTITLSSSTGEMICSVSPDLPLPIYLKVGESNANYFIYELTDLELE